jgi:7-cyano-7-deazaguanine synthase
VRAVSFNYEQRHWPELACARRIARRVGVSHDTLTIGASGLGASSLLGPRASGSVDGARSDGLPVSFIPGRNLLLLTLAAVHEVEAGGARLVMGACLEDARGYPDCRPAFLASASECIGRALDTTIEIETPLLYLDKAASVRLARELGEACWGAIGLSWSCYDPQRDGPSLRKMIPCGACPACVKRAVGFDAAAETDPAAGRSVTT